MGWIIPDGISISNEKNLPEVLNLREG